MRLLPCLVLSLLMTLLSGSGSMAQPHPQQWRDISYVDDTLTGQRMDIYLPGPGEGSFPVVMIIYGSAWFANDRKDQSYQTFGKPLLDAGFAVAAINHRSSREAVFPAQVHDVKAAVRFLRANADQYQLDTSFVAVAGNSSGGHLAAFLGTSGGVVMHSVGSVTVSLEGNRGDFNGISSSVDAVVDWFGPTRFQAMDSCGSRMNHDAPDSPESTLIGGPIQEQDERCALANPITYVDADDPPFLILHGDADPLVPYCQSEMLHQALQQQGVASELIIVPGAEHGPGLFEPEYFTKMVDFLKKARRAKRSNM